MFQIAALDSLRRRLPTAEDGLGKLRRVCLLERNIGHFFYLAGVRHRDGRRRTPSLAR
jgi:hypothetical protein